MADDPLYPRALLRLAADAKGTGHLAHVDCVGTAHNPSCGDKVIVELTLVTGRISALAHQTQACVLTQASAALLAEKAAGADQAELGQMAQSVQDMLAGGAPVAGFEVFAGVAAHAGRHVCVLLPFRAALSAFEAGEEGAVGT